jgi:hypothetical protein
MNAQIVCAMCSQRAGASVVIHRSNDPRVKIAGATSPRHIGGAGFVEFRARSPGGPAMSAASSTRSRSFHRRAAGTDHDRVLARCWRRLVAPERAAARLGDRAWSETARLLFAGASLAVVLARLGQLAPTVVQLLKQCALGLEGRALCRGRARCRRHAAA